MSFSTNEDIIESREFSAERKHFVIEMRENDRGKFLRITEEGRGKRNCVIIPSTGIEDFRDALDDVLDGEDPEDGD